MAMAVGTASWWEPGVEEGRVGPLYPLAMPMLVPTPRHSLGFATDTEVEFLRPLYPGDTLRQVGRLVSVTRKRLKVGDGAFFTVEIEFINQNDETVAISVLRPGRAILLRRVSSYGEVGRAADF